MEMARVENIPEVIIIEPIVHGDSRGRFLETYRAEGYLDLGIPGHFVQDNVSYSMKSVLRGLHYQIGHPQGKLVWVAKGEIFDVAVDIRKGSPTFGKWMALHLSSDNHKQIYIPEGFAHGFCATTDEAIVIYKCSDYYSPKDERGIRWDDPALNIEWPVELPMLSEKDWGYPFLNGVPPHDLPIYEDDNLARRCKDAENGNSTLRS